MDAEVKELSERDMAAREYLTPPAVLYHYTSTIGLTGILESNSIWATNHRYLNDVAEFSHGFKFLVPAFRREIAAISAEPWAAYLVDQFIDGLREQAVYVASFCESGDLLSQWRGYAASNGFAIGFATRTDLATGVRPRFERVHYGAEGNAEFADWTAKFVAESFGEIFDPATMDQIKSAPTSEHDQTREKLAKLILHFTTQGISRAAHLCALLKDGAFEEEKEWRIAVPGARWGHKDENLRFRPGPLGLTPYIPIDLKMESGRLPISSITVGPGPHSELRVNAVKMLLEHLGYEAGIDVTASSAPFRP